MSVVGAQSARAHVVRQRISTAVIAWVAAALFYFYQYSLRSSPSVIIPQLSAGFGLSPLSIASLVGIFYYGYSCFSLIAGAAMDRLGPRRVVPVAAITVGFGALLFASGNRELASLGRLMQGAGGVFALIGDIYIATKNFPASQAATLVGATQMFGMAGGASGQFIVGPLMRQGLAWDGFWLLMGIVGLGLGTLLFFVLPTEEWVQASGEFKRTAEAFYAVLKNPQSILCGIIAGLLFIPTTILDMVWGVRYLQEAHGLDYASAVMRSATVPFGWIIGCPLMGFISDRLGRRKPVLIAGAAVLFLCLIEVLFGDIGKYPRYFLGFVAGIASGAAMLPYTVIKEANPPAFKGTATGVINFLNFTFSALLGPVFTWLLHRASGGTGRMHLGHYQTAFAPLLFGVGVAIVLALVLQETGSAVRALE